MKGLLCDSIEQTSLSIMRGNLWPCLWPLGPAAQLGNILSASRVVVAQWQGGGGVKETESTEDENKKVKKDTRAVQRIKNRSRSERWGRWLLSCEIDGLARWETLSQGEYINRLVQKLTRSLTRGIAFLFLRSGILSMLYKAPPILDTKHAQSNIQHQHQLLRQLLSRTWTWEIN